MTISLELKKQLLRLKNRLPIEKQDEFMGSIKRKLSGFATENVLSYTLVGAAIGALIDFIPGSSFISDDWVEIGAVLGAWVGYSKDKKEREQREKIKKMIMESLREVMDE